MLRMIPGFSDVAVLRFGTIHRNIFLNIPGLCEPYLRDRRRPGLYYAGQICGVEGYVESIASAIVVALALVAEERGRTLPPLPRETMLGSLMSYVHTPARNFQPMNANFGIVPAPARPPRGRKARHEETAQTALAAIEAYRSGHPWLFE
jgi:methylenetetrahydrofolate--tRNA-(uracil-5-)-methyltransferase